MSELKSKAQVKSEGENKFATYLSQHRLTIEMCLKNHDLEFGKKFVAMLSLIDGMNVPSELFKEFSEILHPKDPVMVCDRSDWLMCDWLLQD